MPNWVHNTLTVIGDSDKLNDFYAKAGFDDEEGRVWNDATILLTPAWLKQNALTTPEDTPGLIELNRADNSEKPKQREWPRFGKMDKPHFLSGAVHFCFDTAWNPPYDWLSAMQEMYPSLKFKLVFTEEMLGFTGVFYTTESGDIGCEKGSFTTHDSAGNLLTRAADGLSFLNEEGQQVEFECGVYSFSSTAYDYKAWFEQC